ncbi:MAG: FapA family protein [Tissierellaceae bacterium]|nr:FapA family protein [Tissierellaceae bacterium]
MYKIGQNIILDISRDGLNGYITIKSKDEDKDKETLDCTLEKDSILREIQSYFSYGLDLELVLRILECNTYDEKTQIAWGKAPISGKDGTIKYFFEMNKPMLPKLRDDGTVDYKELDSINVVKKDDVLAEIIPPEEGVDGIKVNGDPIPHVKGKTPRFSYGKNTFVSSDGRLLSSTIDGLVEFSNGKISVSEILVLEYINNATGNIDFTGNVIINKDILNGFSLTTTGSVEIKGAVEGGNIKCNGDVLVRQGIQGYNKLTVNSNGNLSTKFIENSIITVSGNIAAEAIMHSDVSSKSNILVIGRKGLIVGGICRAKFEIRAKIIGSSMATTTVLEVGIDPELKQRTNELEEQIKVKKGNIDRIEQSLKVLEFLKRTGRLDGKKLELYSDLTKVNIQLDAEIIKMEKELLNVTEKIGNMARGQIKVSDTIYPGVKIVIGNSFMYIRDEMKRCTFYEDGGDIRVGPY